MLYNTNLVILQVQVTGSLQLKVSAQDRDGGGHDQGALARALAAELGGVIWVREKRALVLCQFGAKQPDSSSQVGVPGFTCKYLRESQYRGTLMSEGFKVEGSASASSSASACCCFTR